MCDFDDNEILQCPWSRWLPTFLFLKKYWDIVGDDVWRLVKEALESGSVDPNLLETLIVLIPKWRAFQLLKTFVQLVFAMLLTN